MVFIICGVAGSGKTTVGTLLSERLALPFYDADDFHSKENIDKMKSGLPLNDEGRTIWLLELSLRIIEWEGSGGAVLACSALKESYRQILVPNTAEKVTWIILYGSQELIKTRITERKQHFFNHKLLDSQFKIFEMPNYGWHFNIEDSGEFIVQKILEKYLDH